MGGVGLFVLPEALTQGMALMNIAHYAHAA